MTEPGCLDHNAHSTLQTFLGFPVKYFLLHKAQEAMGLTSFFFKDLFLFLCVPVFQCMCVSALRMCLLPQTLEEDVTESS